MYTTVVLSRYLQTVNTREPARWQNKTAVELGAGTGIVACALGSLRVPGLKVWSTDLAQLLPLAKQNVALNQLEDVVEVEELEWYVSKEEKVRCDRTHDHTLLGENPCRKMYHTNPIFCCLQIAYT